MRKKFKRERKKERKKGVFACAYRKRETVKVLAGAILLVSGDRLTPLLVRLLLVVV